METIIKVLPKELKPIEMLVMSLNKVLIEQTTIKNMFEIIFTEKYVENCDSKIFSLSLNFKSQEKTIKTERIFLFVLENKKL